MVYGTLDDLKQKKIFDAGQNIWLIYHDNEVEKWLDENITDIYERDSLAYNILHGSDSMLHYVFYMYLQQKMKHPGERFFDICDKINSWPGGIVPVIGPKQRGKTCLVYTICEFLFKHYKRRIWWHGPPADLPYFFEGQTLDESKIPAGAIVVRDEAGIQSSSREGMNQEQIDSMKKLALAGQHNKTIFFLTQHQAIIDLTILRQTEAIIFVAPTVLTLKNERLVVNEYLNFFMPKRVGEALYYDNDIISDISWDLPEWWKPKYSRPYAPFNNRTEAYIFALKILKDFPNETNKRIANFMTMRDFKIEEPDIEFLRHLADEFTIEKLLAMNEKNLTEIIDHGYDDTPIQELVLKKKHGIRRYAWEQDPFVKQYWSNKLEKNPGLELKMRINRNRFLINYIKQQSLENHVVVIIAGPTGGGKSWGSMGLAETMGMINKKPWSVISNEKKNVNFSYESTLERNTTAEALDTLITDDKLKRRGYGSNIETWDMKNTIQALRKKKVNFIFNSKEFNQDFEPKFYLEAYAFDRKEGISKMIMYSPDLLPMGYITLRKPSDENIRQYVQIEDEFKTKVQARSGDVASPSSEKMDNTIKKLLEDPDFMSRQTQKERTAYIMKKFGMGSEVGSLVMAEATAQMRQKGLLQEKPKKNAKKNDDGDDE